MSDEPPNARVLAFAPRPDEFEKRVRSLAQDTRNVKWSFHARGRMRERDISIRVALTVIREGVVMGNIEPGKHPGEWKAKFVRNLKGRRDVGVVALLVRENYVLVKTVEWEDIR
jgi:hypothetical protein